MLGMVHETMRFGLTLRWSKTIQPFILMREVIIPWKNQDFFMCSNDDRLTHSPLEELGSKRTSAFELG